MKREVLKPLFGKDYVRQSHIKITQIAPIPAPYDWEKEENGNK
jgi:hypothetical protein